MNEWSLAAVVLMGALLPCLWVALARRPFEGLVGIELGGVISSLVLLLLSQAYHREAFADLAVVLALLSLAGSLAYARFLERSP